MPGSEPSRRDVLRWGAGAGVGAVATSFLAACSARSHRGQGTSTASTAPGTTDTVKVGVVTPLGGIGSFIGAVTQASLHTAVQQVNSTGGIGGRKVELVVRDAGSDP